MEARLASSVFAQALMRRAETEGGFAVLLSKGDPTAGSLLVVLAEKGRKQRVLERTLHPDGSYVWTDCVSQAAENEEEFERFLSRRRKFDPDIWVLELDIASAERFAAEMNELD